MNDFLQFCLDDDSDGRRPSRAEIDFFAEAEEEVEIAPVVTIAPAKITLFDLWIRTRDKRLICLGENLNPSQVRYLDNLCPRWREGDTDLSGLRELILKGRQMGLSTLIIALLFLQTINNPLIYSVVVAHDADSTERMFQMVKRFWEHLPTEKRPRTSRNNRRELVWPDLDSSFFIGTAGATDFGRSATLNYIHLSEVASYPDAQTLVTGLLQAVSTTGVVFAESTAKGFGNWFQEEWDSAEKGDSVYSPRFFEWFDEESYRLPVPEGFERTAQEEEWGRVYGLDDEQLVWFREKAKELRNDLLQEYPLCPEDAFLVSGAPYFDRSRIRSLLLECKSPLFTADFRHHADEVNGSLKVVLDDLAHKGVPGRFVAGKDLEIFELPIQGEAYILAADPAEGLNPSGDPDSCSAIVYKISSWEEVAHLEGCWNTHEFGMMLSHLGRFYNTALLACERNTHGHAVLNSILKMAMYPPSQSFGNTGVYFHEEFDAAKPKKELVRKPGWPTTSKTKAFALDVLRNKVESHEIILHSKRTLGQMLRFVNLPGGKFGGEAGSHDDNVMSAAIGAALLESRPMSRKRDMEFF